VKKCEMPPLPQGEECEAFLVVTAEERGGERRGKEWERVRGV
jgi:hypothetical protein